MPEQTAPIPPAVLSAGSAPPPAAPSDPAPLVRHGEDTRARSDCRDHQLNDMNAPANPPHPTQGLRTVTPIEENFRDRVFDDSEVG